VVAGVLPIVRGGRTHRASVPARAYRGKRAAAAAVATTV